MMDTASISKCRDVKPENLLVRFMEAADGTPLPHLRLIDLGSAVDPFSGKELYGEKGPSPLEHTQEYAPPEALLGRWDFPLPRSYYELWTALQAVQVSFH